MLRRDETVSGVSPTLRQSLPTQFTARGFALADRLLEESDLNSAQQERIVEDMAVLPEAWLERLTAEDVSVVVLGSHQTLADTSLLKTYTPDQLQQEADQALEVIATCRNEVESNLEDPDSAYQRHWASQELAENLAAALGGQGLGFWVRPTRGSVDWDHLQAEAGVEEQEAETFRALTEKLNGALTQVDQTTIQADWGLVVVPYHCRQGKRVSPVNQASLAEIRGAELLANKGAHIWPNRLVMIHETALPDPSPTAGSHRVVIHELGHAIDHICDQLYPDHRETIDKFYREDLEHADRFLTRRMRDNPREYFAEAVEAYFTEPSEGYKGENHYLALQQRNPRLYGYLDELFRR